MKEKVVRTKPLPEDKLDLVKELATKMSNSRTVLLASCKSLPSQQFHDIKKKLREKAEIKVAKITAISRAIDNVEKGAIKNLKKELGADVVLFFSNVDPFELSGLLSDSQSPTKAKPGDLAPSDIEIEPGPTELVPGPAISELGSVGLKVAVKDGKLEIQKGAIVAHEGEPITEAVASVLAKLNITPMKVGFLPLAAYDSEDDKVYVGIKIDKEATLEETKDLIKKALGFAVNIKYPAKETISFFIAKAGAEEKAIEKLLHTPKEEAKEEAKEEPKAEETPVETEEKTEENKEPTDQQTDTREEQN